MRIRFLGLSLVLIVVTLLSSSFLQAQFVSPYTHIWKIKSIERPDAFGADGPFPYEKIKVLFDRKSNEGWDPATEEIQFRFLSKTAEALGLASYKDLFGREFVLDSYEEPMKEIFIRSMYGDHFKIPSLEEIADSAGKYLSELSCPQFENIAPIHSVARAREAFLAEWVTDENGNRHLDYTKARARLADFKKALEASVKKYSSSSLKLIEGETTEMPQIKGQAVYYRIENEAVRINFIFGPYNPPFNCEPLKKATPVQIRQ